jgi:hypothetical protein
MWEIGWIGQKRIKTREQNLHGADGKIRKNSPKNSI